MLFFHFFRKFLNAFSHESKKMFLFIYWKPAQQMHRNDGKKQYFPEIKRLCQSGIHFFQKQNFAIYPQYLDDIMIIFPKKHILFKNHTSFDHFLDFRLPVTIFHCRKSMVLLKFHHDFQKTRKMKPPHNSSKKCSSCAPSLFFSI